MGVVRVDKSDSSLKGIGLACIMLASSSNNDDIFSAIKAAMYVERVVLISISFRIELKLYNLTTLLGHNPRPRL